jgi:hypothetical protein
LGVEELAGDIAAVVNVGFEIVEVSGLDGGAFLGLEGCGGADDEAGGQEGWLGGRGGNGWDRASLPGDYAPEWDLSAENG